MTRMLEGNFEDLDLSEVLRVISLSRKSGTLIVDAAAHTAEIRVASGRVMSVRHAGSNATLAEVLLDARVLTPRAFVGDPTRTLDSIVRSVVEESGDPGIYPRVESVIKERIEDVLLVLSELDEGNFALTVTDVDAELLRFPGDTTYSVVDGVDGDTLVRELRRRRTAKLKDPLARSRPSTIPTVVDDHRRPEVVVVNGNDAHVATMTREAGLIGIDVIGEHDAHAGIGALKRLTEHDDRYALIDLVMPRSNGRGILGGLEVLARANELNVAAQCFLVLDGPHDDAAARARELGAAGTLPRPRDGEGVATLLNAVLTALGRPPVVDAPVDLAFELRSEIGEKDWAPDPDLRLDESARSLEVLRSLLAQVSNPTFEEEIPLLLLRFAAAFFSRGALFGYHAKTEQLVGIGGFGLSQADPGRAIHAMRIPASADTVFSRAMRERAGVRQHLFESEWNTRIIHGLAGPRPKEVYTAPLMSPRGLEAVLYADNATTGRPFPDVALLDIFVQQAGAALERSSMKRHLDDLMAKRGVS